MRGAGTFAAIPVAVLLAGMACAQEQGTPSANDFGGIGLLQTRTARMSEAGTLEVGGMALDPDRRVYVLFQPLDWLEVDFRYTDVTNVLKDGTVLPLSETDFFGDIFGFDGDGTLLDRGFDMKIRLAEEGRIMPAIAAGIQDMFGRSRLGGEYVVASKRFGPLDISFGIGWGFFGSRDLFGNPLSAFGNDFKRRDLAPGTGRFNFDSYFSGTELSLFGGIEWYTPIRGLSFKIEYAGSDPERLPFNSAIDEDLPVNFGLNWRPLPWLDMAVGFERGNAVMARTAVRFDFFDLPALLRPLDSRNLPDGIPDGLPAAPASVPEEPLVLRLKSHLAARGFANSAIHVERGELAVHLLGAAPDDAALRRLADELLALMPADMDRIWIGRQGMTAQSARLYDRREDHQAGAATIAAIAAGTGAAGRAGVRIDGGTLAFELEDGAPVPGGEALSAQSIVALPDDIARVAWREDGRAVADLSLEERRPVALARAILAELGDTPVSGLRMHGSRLLELTTGDAGNAADWRLDTLAARAGVDQVLVAEQESLLPPDRKAVATQLFDAFAREGIEVRALVFGDGEAMVWVGHAPLMEEARLIGRTARMLSEQMPPGIERLTVARTLGEAELYRVSLLRRDLVQALQGRGSPEEIAVNRRFSAVETSIDDAGVIRNRQAFPHVSWGVAPVVLQNFGDPDSGVYLADLNVDLLARLELAPGVFVSGALRRFIAGNLDNLEGSPTPGVPVVRSDIRDFIREGRTAIPYLQADFIRPLGNNLVGRVSAGLFEQMYGGVSGELLYRPAGAHWALGGEINWLQRRDPDQFFDFSGRDVVTGDITLYTEWAAGIRSELRAGRFLAGDWGGTIDISREFDNGVRLGGFLTLTDDTDREFDSDNFDKGVYITIPLGNFWPFAGPREVARSDFRSLTRDTGQRLQLNDRLYDLVERQQRRRILDAWARILE